jgi:3-deoxy-D-manno-octulosonate 8-phosphate phosphatase (KDO 8-P phosphatase)
MSDTDLACLASPEVLARARKIKLFLHFTTRRHAGRGTAREVVELILKAQGRWEEAVPQALA